jgi:aminoglycoside 3-N-acetyltransferase
MRLHRAVDAVRGWTPKPLLDAFRRLKKWRLKQRLAAQRRSGKGCSQNQLLEELRTMGIAEGDNLLVHASFSAIGYVEGGAENLINALKTVVGSNGHLLMPASPVAKLQYDYLKTNDTFDVLHTPSAMGILSETFRKLSGVLRSEHPTESVCVFGPKAEWFVKDHFGQPTPYNEGSPYFKLADKGGKILIIGRNIWVATSLHTLEDAVPDFKFPVYAPEWFEVTVTGYDRLPKKMKTRAHNPEMSLSRHCFELTPLFENAGVLTHHKLGMADCVLLDAKGMFDTMVKAYLEKGVTMYTPHGS